MESEAEGVMLGLGEELLLSKKLGLRDKSEGEISEMLEGHRSSLYRTVCDFLHRPLNKSYHAKESVLMLELYIRDPAKYQDAWLAFNGRT